MTIVLYFWDIVGFESLIGVGVLFSSFGLFRDHKAASRSSFIFLGASFVGSPGRPGVRLAMMLSLETFFPWTACFFLFVLFQNCVGLLGRLTRVFSQIYLSVIT